MLHTGRVQGERGHPLGRRPIAPYTLSNSSRWFSRHLKPPHQGRAGGVKISKAPGTDHHTSCGDTDGVRLPQLQRCPGPPSPSAGPQQCGEEVTCPHRSLGPLCCGPHPLRDPSTPPLPTQTLQTPRWGGLSGSRAYMCVPARCPGAGHAEGLRLMSHLHTAPWPPAEHCHHPRV